MANGPIIFADPIPPSSYFKALITGMPSAGKSSAMLRMLTGLCQGKPFAVISTETDGTAFLRDIAKWKQLDWPGPFRAPDLEAMINAAVQQGFAGLGIDAISALWGGKGGVLDVVPADAKYSAWKQPKQELRDLMDTIMSAPIHIVATARSRASIKVVPKKQNGEIIYNEKGQTTGVPVAVNKIGFDFNSQFEFHCTFDVQADGPALDLECGPHMAHLSNDGISLGRALNLPRYFYIEERLGEGILRHVKQNPVRAVGTDKVGPIIVTVGNRAEWNGRLLVGGEAEAISLPLGEYEFIAGDVVRFLDAQEVGKTKIKGKEVPLFNASRWEPAGESNA